MSETGDFHCLVCRASASTFVRSAIKGDEEQRRHRIVRCASCGLQQMHPPHFDLAYYEDDRQVKAVTQNFGTTFDTLQQHAWIEAGRRVRRLAEHFPLVAGSSVLDIGGGYGHFGSVLLDQHPECRATVLEPSSTRIEQGRRIIAATRPEMPSPEFVCGTVDSAIAAELNQYDAITMFHVLEHVVDPVGLVRDAVELLRPGGFLCIEVPNADDELIAAVNGFADRWYMIEHVTYMGPSNLRDIVTRAVPTAPEILVRGYQRYGLFNYVYWLEHGSPRGADPDLFDGEDRNWLETRWRQEREARLTTDALYLVLRTPES